MSPQLYGEIQELKEELKQCSTLGIEVSRAYAKLAETVEQVYFLTEDRQDDVSKLINAITAKHIEL